MWPGGVWISDEDIIGGYEGGGCDGGARKTCKTTFKNERSFSVRSDFPYYNLVNDEKENILGLHFFLPNASTHQPICKESRVACSLSLKGSDI